MHTARALLGALVAAGTWSLVAALRFEPLPEPSEFATSSQGFRLAVRRWHTHILVDSVKAAKKAFKDITKSVEQSKVVAVDIEGDLSATGRLSLIQIGLESQAVFLFDVLKCPDLLNENSRLRALLSGSATKVLHDCRNDAAALKGQFNIVLTQVWDTQTTHAILMGKEPRSYQQGLNVILKTYAGESNKNKAKVKHGPGVWEERPIPSLLLVM